MFKQIAGRFLQVVSWCLNHLEWITHPGHAADHLDPFICRFLEHESDPDDTFCYRCREDTGIPKRCIRCGGVMPE